MSIFSSNINNGDVSIDMKTIDNYSIREPNHKAGGLEPPKVMSELTRPVADNKYQTMEDDNKTDSRSLTIGSSDGALVSPITQAFDDLQDLFSSDKAHITYKCITQVDECYGLCIGEDREIPRWCSGSEIPYIIRTESFRTPGAAALVASAMAEAISTFWGNIIDVNFKQVGRDDPATFQIEYMESHSSHPDAYAISFLPTTQASSLVVYRKALEHPNYLVNILAHELGHILGLRHEFAIEREGFLPSVRFGSKNHESIMNYFDHLSKLQVGKQDREEVAAFYAYKEAYFRGLPIVEIQPQLHKFNKCRGGSQVFLFLPFSFFLIYIYITIHSK